MSDAVWIVLPTYNEVENLGAVVAELRAALAGSGETAARILVVDDASPDGTGALADTLAARHPEVHVLHRKGKQGLGAAYAAGFDEALRHDPGFVVQMDADLSHDPRDVPRLLAAAREGADVVLGSRYVPGGHIRNWSGARRALSAFGSWYARRLLAVPLRDLTGGFKCFRASALAEIPYATARAHGYAFQVETSFRAVRAGLEVVEVPIVFSERREGTSKMTMRIAVEAAWTVPLLRLGRRARGSVGGLRRSTP